jgi:hypothetical protein
MKQGYARYCDEDEMMSEREKRECVRGVTRRYLTLTGGCRVYMYLYKRQQRSITQGRRCDTG